MLFAKTNEMIKKKKHRKEKNQKKNPLPCWIKSVNYKSVAQEFASVKVEN
jgi:hypothetical protein